MKDIYEKLGLFYLGKDAENDALTLYKSKHLTTHAAIIGMTGSGKTGLGIGLIEEAALDNIPSIIIDPKGDMGNLCLAFEHMSASDFEPWMDPMEASNKGKTVSEMAEDTAQMWEKGIGFFGQDKSRVKRFADVPKTIYTPGSSSGVGVNILGSFDAPSIETLDDADTFSALINATVSSLLSLVDIDADPISSREHLLLSNVFKHFWLKGENLSLEALIGHVASPPFKKIGVLGLDSFYPQNERMKLAMLFNNVISSVTFSSWIKGEDLDIQNMLYDENGKAKVSIFSIAHLNDNERMFFVTILLNRYIEWMRRQRGSSSLKAMLYMDEIFGFFPPTKNPPSKEPMLILLKQARAFGTGVVLSTQNPGDIDYKGLSNIGTWFIGKLQTKQDIAKVVDGLSAKSSSSKAEIAEAISTLKSRHFFLKNVHADETQLFYTRWVLSYLKGPMRKDDIRMLMVEQQTKVEEKVDVKSSRKGSAKPILNDDIHEYFNDTNINSEHPFYPSLCAHAEVRYFNQSKSIDILDNIYLRADIEENMREIDWSEAGESEAFDSFAKKAKSDATYAGLPSFITGVKSLKNSEKELSDFLYDTKRLQLYRCKSLKLESHPREEKRDFIVEVEDVLREKKDEAVEKLEEKFKVKQERIMAKIDKAHIKLDKEKSDVTAKSTDTAISIGMTVLGALFGRKTFSASTISKGASALRKGKGVIKEKADVARVESLLVELDEDIIELEEELVEKIEAIEEDFDIENYEVEPLFIKPRRSDVEIEEMAIVWER